MKLIAFVTSMLCVIGSGIFIHLDIGAVAIALMAVAFICLISPIDLA